MEWFCVDDLLPEDCTLCNFHTDSTLTFTTVIVMSTYGKIELRNRMKVDKCGNTFLDEYATDGWEWSYGTIKPKYWFPIPHNKQLLLDKRDQMIDPPQ